jgi:hypothetical protein
VQCFVPDLHEGQFALHTITVCGRSDKSKLDLTHDEGAPILVNHLVDRTADLAKQFVFDFIKPRNFARVLD